MARGTMHARTAAEAAGSRVTQNMIAPIAKAVADRRAFTAKEVADSSELIVLEHKH